MHDELYTYNEFTLQLRSDEDCMDHMNSELGIVSLLKTEFILYR